jgi:secondary thiamine-phosphate synthase enzyme
MDNIKNKISILFNNLGCPFVGYISRGKYMPAHVRSALTQTHLSIPLINGRAALGQWQGVFLYEHRHAASQRQVILHLMGE